jgi:hypothetical protein
LTRHQTDDSAEIMGEEIDEDHESEKDTEDEDDKEGDDE